MSDPPPLPYLPIGTHVSAKYKGAFCEARVRSVDKQVKCRVTFRHGLGSTTIADKYVRLLQQPTPLTPAVADSMGSTVTPIASARRGNARRDATKQSTTVASPQSQSLNSSANNANLYIGAVVMARHPDKLEYIEAVVNKVQDQSLYTVVFDDGDITTLRRTALCIKSGKHFRASESLDSLPLTHPEHFGVPVSVASSPSTPVTAPSPDCLLPSTIDGVDADADDSPAASPAVNTDVSSCADRRKRRTNLGKSHVTTDNLQRQSRHTTGGAASPQSFSSDQSVAASPAADLVSGTGGGDDVIYEDAGVGSSSTMSDANVGSVAGGIVAAQASTATTATSDGFPTSSSSSSCSDSDYSDAADHSSTATGCGDDRDSTVDSDDSQRTDDSSVTPRRRLVGSQSGCRRFARNIVFCSGRAIDGTANVTGLQRDWCEKQPCLGPVMPRRLLSSSAEDIWQPSLQWPETWETRADRKRSGFKHLSLRYVEYADYVARCIWAETGHASLKRVKADAAAAATAAASGEAIMRVPTNWFPAVVVAPGAASIASRLGIDVRRELVIRSFRDGRYYTVAKRNAVAFCQCHRLYMERFGGGGDDVNADFVSAQLRRAVEAALAYMKSDDLPVHWDREVLFTTADFASREQTQVVDVDNGGNDVNLQQEVEIVQGGVGAAVSTALPPAACGVPPTELEKDMVVAMLYEHMEEARGTPIHRAPAIGHCELDLFTLFSTVYSDMGGYQKVTDDNRWREVGRTLGQFNTSWGANQLRIYYKRYLVSFEDVYKTMEERRHEASQSKFSSEDGATYETRKQESRLQRKRSASTSSQASSPGAVSEDVVAERSVTVVSVEQNGGADEDESPLKRRRLNRACAATTVNKPQAAYDSDSAADRQQQQQQPHQLRERRVSVSGESCGDSVAVVAEDTITSQQTPVVNVTTAPAVTFPTATPAAPTGLGRRGVRPYITDDVDILMHDKVKVYYKQTSAIYEAKVIRMRDRDHLSASSNRLFMVHYLGWNSRHDEWIGRSDMAANVTWAETRANRAVAPTSAAPIVVKAKMAKLNKVANSVADPVVKTAMPSTCRVSGEDAVNVDTKTVNDVVKAEVEAHAAEEDIVQNGDSAASAPAEPLADGDGTSCDVAVEVHREETVSTAPAAPDASGSERARESESDVISNVQSDNVIPPAVVETSEQRQQERQGDGQDPEQQQPQQSSSSRSRRSGRALTRFNFIVTFTPEMTSNERIALVQRNIDELRDTYMMLKADLATMERRRKRSAARRAAAPGTATTSSPSPQRRDSAASPDASVSESPPVC